MSSFSQTGIAVVNLSGLTNSLGHPESVKPAFALSLDNRATMGHKKITWAPGSCPWGWLVARAEILVLGGLADSACCTPSHTPHPAVSACLRKAEGRMKATVSVLSLCNSRIFKSDLGITPLKSHKETVCKATRAVFLPCLSLKPGGKKSVSLMLTKLLAT